MSSGSWVCQDDNNSSFTTAINNIASNARLNPDITNIAPRVCVFNRLSKYCRIQNFDVLEYNSVLIINLKMTGNNNAVTNTIASVAIASFELCMRIINTRNSVTIAEPDTSKLRRTDCGLLIWRNTCIGGVAMTLTR